MSDSESDSKLLHDTGLFNDEGHAVSQGGDGWDYYYCGLKRDHITIPGTDGRCGPINPPFRGRRRCPVVQLVAQLAAKIPAGPRI
jgi:hypothetical protein